MVTSAFLLVIFAGTGGTALADGDPPGVCVRRGDPVIRDAIARDPRFRLSFENDGGLFNGGVCWWHSRLQRAVWSLAEFRPDLGKPTRNEAVRIIDNLSHFRGVQVIPGYSNFLSFSADFKKELQSELNAWQLRDGVFKQSWLTAMKGRANLDRNPAKLKRIMDDLYQYSLEGQREGFTPWVMLQLKGIIGAHAALIAGMKKNRAGDGYSLDIVDSNFPERTFTWRYKYGDGQMGQSHYDTVPYRGSHRDVPAIQNALDTYCGNIRDLRPEEPEYPSENGFP